MRYLTNTIILILAYLFIVFAAVTAPIWVWFSKNDSELKSRILQDMYHKNNNK